MQQTATQLHHAGGQRESALLLADVKPLYEGAVAVARQKRRRENETSVCSCCNSRVSGVYRAMPASEGPAGGRRRVEAPGRQRHVHTSPESCSSAAPNLYRGPIDVDKSLFDAQKSPIERHYVRHIFGTNKTLQIRL